MKKPSNDVNTVQELSTAILVNVPRITVVVCIRDPASTAWSRAMRSGTVTEKTIRGPLESQRAVNEAWASFARTFPGRVIFVPLESFSTDPNRYLSLILDLPDGQAPPHPALTMTEAEKEELLTGVFSRESDMSHNERRAKQSGLPVYPVLVNDWRSEASQDQQTFVDSIVAEERVAEISEGLVGLAVNRTRLRRPR